MSFEYIKNRYGVEFDEGDRVSYDDREGTVVGATHYVEIEWDDGGWSPVHPTDERLKRLGAEEEE